MIVTTGEMIRIRDELLAGPCDGWKRSTADGFPALLQFLCIRHERPNGSMLIQFQQFMDSHITIGTYVWNMAEGCWNSGSELAVVADVVDYDYSLVVDHVWSTIDPERGANNAAMAE
jgi:hypothetical protein